MPDSIYSKDYMDRINKLYDPKDHYFVITQWNGERKYKLKNGIVVDTIDKKHLKQIIK